MTTTRRAELVSGRRHDLLTIWAVVAVILIAQSHPSFVEAHQATALVIFKQASAANDQLDL